MLKGCLQWRQLITENPEYLTGINIKIVMGYNIAKTLHLLPRNRGICGKQLAVCNFVQVLQTLTHSNQ